MMKLIPKILVVLTILLCSYNQTIAQVNAGIDNKYKDLSGKYLGQEHPGQIPEIFAKGIISTAACEFAITFTPDGKEIFFTRRPIMESIGNRIMHTYEENGNWIAPQLAPFARNHTELEPFVSPDGQKVFFHSARPHPETKEVMVNDEKIWYSEKRTSGWSNARFLEGLINTGWVMGVSIAQNDNLYLCGEVGDKGGLLKAQINDGDYTTVESICDGIHPYIAPDESYLIYDVIEDNMGDKTALCIMFKEADGTWGEPKRMNDEINATATECFGRVSPDGKYLFFNREGNIYWVDAKVLDEYKNN